MISLIPDNPGGRRHPGRRGDWHPISRLLAILGLIALSPLLAVAGVAIKLSSRGPILFRAERAGMLGRPFRMLKLRTMHTRAGGLDPRITGGDDPRVFRAGRVIRRLKLDELPQLVNVIRGEMVIVGPRPEEPSIVRDHYTTAMLESLAVLPGLASPGSLDYFAGEALLPDDPAEAEQFYVSEVLPRKLALEVVYVRNRTWRYDAEVVVRTLAAVVGVRMVFSKRQAWERAEAERMVDVLRDPASEGYRT